MIRATVGKFIFVIVVDRINFFDDVAVVRLSFWRVQDILSIGDIGVGDIACLVVGVFIVGQIVLYLANGFGKRAVAFSQTGGRGLILAKRVSFALFWTARYDRADTAKFFGDSFCRTVV